MVLEGPAHALLNRFLSAYVANLDASQLKIGIWNGDIRLTNLRLKREALDKFRLPIDVVEGYIGELRMQVPWASLRTNPVKVYIDNIYLLAVPAASTKYDAEEDERRAQAVKQEKLANAEILGTKSTSAMTAKEQAESETLTQSFANRVVDNLQLEIAHIHIRYEDNLSVPGHPFAVGFTLAGFKAFSTDENWEPTFVHNSLKGVHKIAELNSLALYFNTDTTSMAGMGPDEAIIKFRESIATAENRPEHQFVLRPVSGKAKIILRKTLDKGEAKTDIDLGFEELGFVLDEDQYRDALSMIDLFHFYTRQHEYRPLRPAEEEIEANKPRALLLFALTAIRKEVHEKHRRWTWDYFKERRDDRKEYVRLFKLSEQHQLSNRSELDDLEKKLSYKDIRFYRSIARSELGKERAAQREDEKEHPPPKQKQGWLAWAASGFKQTKEESEDAQALDEFKKVIDFDENAVAAPEIDLPPDIISVHMKAELRKGTFALRRNPQGGADASDLVSVVFDAFRATLDQRVKGLIASIALGSIAVFDGTRPGSRHPQIVRVKEDKKALVRAATETGMVGGPKHATADDPFFFAEFENKPLDERADVAVTLRMRFLEIIYHRGYVEEIVRFFKPPESQLESVGALIDVASETLEGIRKETRAGLEYALDKHRTVDLRVDMNAPIIVVPEDVTVERCQHIVLDAGHIAVESELVDKSQMDDVRKKQSQQYSERDFQQLESLMYDKFFVRLEDAQLLMGDTLESCLNALEGHTGPELHVLERISMTFKAENSILPKAPNLARIRVSGELPDLRVNFSDRKYKILMRMIDVAIPKFGDGGGAGHEDKMPEPHEAQSGQGHRRKTSTFVQAPMYLTGRDEEYNVEVSDEDEDDGEEDHFVLAPDLVEGGTAFKQVIFGFGFTVKQLGVAIFKSDPKDVSKDRLLAIANLEHFSLEFALRSFDMTVDILLRALWIEDKMVDDGSKFQRLITSDQVEENGEADEMRDLVSIKYVRVQPNSPEFMSVHEGINQSVNIELATINMILTRASILMLFDFILTTFTNPEAPQEPVEQPHEGEAVGERVPVPAASVEKLRVKIRLIGFGVVLNDDGVRIATLALKEADVAVLLRGPTMRVSARLGDMHVKDDMSTDLADASYARMLMIEGSEVADFAYETYDATDAATYPGYDSLVRLKTGSLRITFLEEPIRRILHFLTRFARMKAVLDSARNAAAGAAASAQPANAAKMHYDIHVRTPIFVLPRAEDSRDRIVANLGELKVENKFEGDNVSKIEASITSIKLTSETAQDKGKLVTLKMLEDLDFKADITTRQNIDRTKDKKSADMQIQAHLSDVKLNLTQAQYCALMVLAGSIPRAFAPEPDDELTEVEEDQAMAKVEERALVPVSDAGKVPNGHATVDLLPELPDRAHTVNGEEVALWPKMEVQFGVKTVYLELYSSNATADHLMKENSLSRFSLHQTELRMRTLSNDAMEAELLLKSFTIRDTHVSRQTRFRDIVPGAKHESHQFMLSYTMTGGSERAGVANLTIDTPTFIFSLEPLFALATFFTAPFVKNEEEAEPLETIAEDPVVPESSAAEPQQPWLTYRVNIVSAKVMLLAEPNRNDSEAIVLSINQVLLSQEHVLLLDVSQLGMFLCRMDKQSETVRLLDNFDLTVSLDTNAPKGRSMTSIEITVQALVLRVSYRDILLMTSVLNKASELQGKQQSQGQSDQKSKDAAKKPESRDGSSERALQPRRPSHARRVSSNAAKSGTSRKASRAKEMRYIVSQEQLKASFAGLQLILIGDVHELPILDVKTGKLMLRASEWSKEMRADVIISPYINFFNLSTSHWEPLLDPWEFAIHVGKRLNPAGMDIEISAKKRAEMNVTATFVDLALTSMAVWNKEGDSVLRTARGHGTPFLVKNRTGYKIYLWNAADVHKHSSTAQPTALENGRDTPWRFEDWKTMRENLSTSSHNSLAVAFDGVAWERLKHVAVDREGEHIYTLKPKVDGTFHRMLCEVKLVDNVKHVTLRSTVQIQNLTLVPAEMVVVDEKGKRDSPIFKIAPGGECSVPIQAAYSKRVRVRPDSGFGYNWSETKLHWQDMVKRPRRLMLCAPKEEHAEDADFRFETFALHDKDDPLIRHYPRISLRLRVPMEIENLLPYDVRYRLYDKNLQRNYASYLRRGGLTPVAIADIDHLLLLSVEIQDTNFKRSDFAIVSTDNPEDMPQEKILSLEDHDGISMDLRIEYHKYADSGKAFKVQIYSPYAFINRTGLDFALKTKAYLGGLKNVAGLKMYAKDGSRKSQKPWLFNYPSNDRRNRALLSVDGSDFSAPVSFETIGADNALSMPNAKGDQEVHIGMRVAEGLGSYKFTKVVTIYPRFIVKNNLSEPLRVRASGSEERMIVQPGERQPFFWLPVDANFCMSASFENSKWSPLFSMQDLGRVHIRTEHAQRGQQLLSLDTMLEGPTFFLRFNLETGRWPFLLKNDSDQPLAFAQAEPEVQGTLKRYNLPPHQSVPYAWDEPSRENKVIRLMTSEGALRDISIMEIGAQLPWRFRSQGDVRTLSMDIRNDHATQVLSLTPYIEAESLFKLQKRPTDTLSRTSSFSSTRDVQFEATETDTVVTFSFTINLAGLGISIVDRKLREMIYVSFRGLKVEYKDMTDRQSIGIITQWIQIDNQLKNCLFPIIFYPTRAPKDEQDLQAHPNLQFSVTLLKDQAHGVMFFKYATLLLQEMSLEVDEAFLYALMDFAKFKGASWDDTTVNQLTDEPAEIPEPEQANADSFVFFEALHLQPIQIDLSFMRTESDEGSEPRTFLDNRNPMAFALNALTMALGNVNEAPVQLRALFIENVRLSWPVLIERTTLHYTNEVVGQLYRVLGSADFIGNPVGLFKNVASGVSDLWYEPFNGVALYGDRDIPFGVARGAGSLIRKSVFGFSDSISKVTGSIGKGLSAASLDAEWQARRRAAMRRNKPKHAIGGLSVGAQSLVTDVASGIEGIFKQPIEGLEKEGAAGLFKGMGKGVVGLFAKPAVGLADFVSNTATGIRNTTTLFEGGAIERVRQPRFVASDGILRPYSEREALGQSWLHSLGFRYEKDVYVAHLVLGGQDDTAVILTESRILLIQSVRLRVIWDVPLSELKTISMEPKGLQLVLRTGDNGPFLPITSDANRDWLFAHFRRVVTSWNATTGA